VKESTARLVNSTTSSKAKGIDGSVSTHVGEARSDQTVIGMGPDLFIDQW
jgi:hypothetical protein